jgi:hypothetical protein
MNTFATARKWLRQILLTALVAFFASTAQAANIADSVADFSGVQGQHNWYYGYYQGTFAPSAFQLMPTYSLTSPRDTWVVDYDLPLPQYWTRLDKNGGHSNGTTTSEGRTPLEQWSVRRWISGVDGIVSLTGNIADLNGQSGNGMIGHIFVDNNTPVYTVGIKNGDDAGINYSVAINVTVGTVVDFAIDPKNSNDWADSTRFTAVIEALPGLPGDYNHNSVVDAADYTVWRHTFGQTGAGLAADGNGNGVIGAEDYDVWRNNFGARIANGSGASSESAAVPEPSSLGLVLLATVLLAVFKHPSGTVVATENSCVTLLIFYFPSQAEHKRPDRPVLPRSRNVLATLRAAIIRNDDGINGDAGNLPLQLFSMHQANVRA